MPKHEFTPEETARGNTNSLVSRAKALKLERFGIKQMTKRQELELAEKILSNPAVLGTMAYLFVDGLESASNKVASSDTTQNVNVLGQMFGDLPLFGIPLRNFGLNTSNLDYAALKLAILAYIATGGNISGSFATLAGVLAPK